MNHNGRKLPDSEFQSVLQPSPGTTPRSAIGNGKVSPNPARLCLVEIFSEDIHSLKRRIVIQQNAMEEKQSKIAKLDNEIGNIKKLKQAALIRSQETKAAITSEHNTQLLSLATEYEAKKEALIKDFQRKTENNDHKHEVYIREQNGVMDSLYRQKRFCANRIEECGDVISILKVDLENLTKEYHKMSFPLRYCQTAREVQQHFGMSSKASDAAQLPLHRLRYIIHSLDRGLYHMNIHDLCPQNHIPCKHESTFDLLDNVISLLHLEGEYRLLDGEPLCKKARVDPSGDPGVEGANTARDTKINRMISDFVSQTTQAERDTASRCTNYDGSNGLVGRNILSPSDAWSVDVESSSLNAMVSAHSTLPLNEDGNIGNASNPPDLQRQLELATARVAELKKQLSTSKQQQQQH